MTGTRPASPSTPRKRKLLKANQRLGTQVSRLKKNLTTGTPTQKTRVLELVSKYVSGAAFELIKSQINMCGRQRTGNRYSDDEKLFALSLFHASPKCYRMLRKVFILPGLSTLKRCMRNVDIRPGFHSAIFEGLRLKAEHMPDECKLCAIVFD